jgi:hypothetical protein
MSGMKARATKSTDLLTLESKQLVEAFFWGCPSAVVLRCAVSQTELQVATNEVVVDLLVGPQIQPT